VALKGVGATESDSAVVQRDCRYHSVGIELRSSDSTPYQIAPAGRMKQMIVTHAAKNTELLGLFEIG
jgi:hypothetical protein